jgi:hypothetical protein
MKLARKIRVQEGTQIMTLLTHAEDRRKRKDKERRNGYSSVYDQYSKRKGVKQFHGSNVAVTTYEE